MADTSMTQVFFPPDATEFFERGFELSSEHAPDDCTFAFERSYADGNTLALTFVVGSTTSLYLTLAGPDKVLTTMTLERVVDVAFQSWHGERTIRCGFSSRSVAMDLRIHYDPVASVHFGALSQYE